jgi:hypothetical protein
MRWGNEEITYDISNGLFSLFLEFSAASGGRSVTGAKSIATRVSFADDQATEYKRRTGL